MIIFNLKTVYIDSGVLINNKSSRVIVLTIGTGVDRFFNNKQIDTIRYLNFSNKIEGLSLL